MKKLFLIVALAFAVPVAVTTSGCASISSTKPAQVTTLKIIGTTAKTSVDAAAVLLREGKITVAQWQRIADVFDHKFQPAFNLAVAAVNSDLSSPASQDILTLAAQLAAVIAEVTAQSKS